MAVIIDGTAGVTVPIVYQNAQTVSTTYSITSATNAMSVGAITIPTGVSVTVPTGSRWVIL